MMFEQALGWFKVRTKISKSDVFKEYGKVAIAALEKQIPKKVKPKQRGNSTDFCCPRCGSRIRVMRGKFWIGGYKDKFCRYCGCELDWSDTE